MTEPSTGRGHGAPTPYAELADVIGSLPLLLREARRARGISQRQAAAQLGMSFATVSRMEAGHDCALLQRGRGPVVARPDARPPRRRNGDTLMAHPPTDYADYDAVVVERLVAGRHPGEPIRAADAAEAIRRLRAVVRIRQRLHIPAALTPGDNQHARLHDAPARPRTKG